MKNLLQIVVFILLINQMHQAQWTQIGLSDKSIIDIEARDSDIFAITADSGAVFYSSDNGFSWNKIVEANAEDIAISKSGKLFLVKNDSLFSTSNLSEGWQYNNMEEQIIDSLLYGCRAKNTVLSPEGTIFCHYKYSENWVCEADGFAISTDDGFTWSTPNLYKSGKLFGFNDQFIFTVGFAFCMGGGGSASFISSDSGETWQYGGAPATSLLECFSNGNVIIYGPNFESYSGTGPIAVELMISKDTCHTWETLDTLIYLQGISVSNGSKEFLLAEAIDSGIVLYSDEGVKLSLINEGLTNLNVYELASDNKEYIYVGTEDGLWRRNLSEVITSELTVSVEVPNEFLLSQNYPNPFNPSTKISWQIPIGSQATLKVFDILGKEVATLVNENKPAGKYETEFNAESAAGGLPSGVYFYRLQAGEFLQTRKMILLK